MNRSRDTAEDDRRVGGSLHTDCVSRAESLGRGVGSNLNVGREIAELPLPGMPHLGSGISWLRDGRRVMATPHLRQAKLSVIDIDKPEIAGLFEKPLVLVRPDGHIAWRGDAPPDDPGALIDRVRGA